MLYAALNTLNHYGRIVACGMISGYNDSTPRPGPSNLMNVIGKRLTIRGFIISDHYDQFEDFFNVMEPWVASGEVVFRESIIEGISQAPQAFMALFNGENIGKQIVRLS